jgi:ketosteroid isomerase-like protein
MMNRRKAISLAAGLVCSAVFVMANTASAQQSDVDKVKAAIDALHAGLSSLDIKKIDDLWVHEPHVMAVQPRDKAISVGWEAVHKSFEATTGFWAELKVTRQSGPQIHVNGNVAWAEGIVLAGGKSKAGDTIAGAPTFEHDVFEKRGDRWLLVSHSAWRVPQ